MIGNYYITLPLQDKFLRTSNLPQNILNVAKLHCHKSTHQPKKFDLVHQTVSPCERMEIGNETRVRSALDLLINTQAPQMLKHLPITLVIHLTKI